MAPPPPSAHGRVFHFDITPEPLSQALRTYAQICGQDVIFTESVVAGAGTTSLVGDFTADDALSRLLAGTKLVVERSPSGALMIRRQQANSAAAAAGQSDAARLPRPIRRPPPIRRRLRLPIRAPIRHLRPPRPVPRRRN